MKFLVDAHLPPGLCALPGDAGHDALHTSRMPAQNQSTNQIINDLSLSEQRVVISKDTDFYYSHLLHQKPWKLVLARTGNTPVGFDGQTVFGVGGMELCAHTNQGLNSLVGTEGCK